MAASDPRQSPGFRRRLLAARLFVWAERVWPAVWPAVGVAGLFLATSLLGLWYGLTTVPHAVLLALFAAGLAAALWRARQAFRLAPPRSALPARDPWALRAAVLLLLVLGLVDARGEYGSRLASAFAFVGQGSAAV